MTIFSQRIKELRIAQGLTLRDVANRMGVSLMAYAHYEYGDNQPSIETLAKLCDIFDVSSDYLIGRTDSY